ncbi:lipoprotein [Microbispora corallina]|uniref:Lipoprotein n=1 Tax=Microbispora corallina TaxID=83302 RepID=A0ABQ4FZ21_9ACTN|nr:hypothetical protein [Microbispora corallina]GIH40043.1 lipoprotein [Microbispora corallina]
MTGLVVCVALALESRAIRRGLDDGPRRSPLMSGPRRSPSVSGPGRSPLVVRVGMGPVRAARAAAALPPFDALAVAGLGGALDDGLRPGDVLVATEVRWDGAVLPCPYGPALAADLARAGLPVRTGPLVTSPRVVHGAGRRRLAAEGARAADMESGPLAAAAEGRPFAAVRVVVDTPAVPLLSPATVPGALAALRALRRIGPALVRWDEATRSPPAEPGSGPAGPRRASGAGRDGRDGRARASEGGP